jgi:DNA-directed RNA polymerase specialized sigma24 family protein
MKPNRNWLMFEHEGKQRCLTEIARMVGVKPGTMNMRISRGMTLEQAIQAPDMRQRHQRQIKEGRCSTE